MNNKTIGVIVSSILIIIIIGVVGYYFILNNDKKYSFSLQGDNPYILSIGDSYNEEGIKVFQGNKDVSHEVMVDNAIDTNKEGTYRVLYYYKNSLIAEREVKVIKNKTNNSTKNNQNNANNQNNSSTLTSEDENKNESTKNNQNNANSQNNSSTLTSEDENKNESTKNNTTNNSNTKKEESKTTVKKKNDSVIIKYVESVYTGNEVKATANATSNTKITITYYSDSKCTKKTSNPKAVGTYYAIAKSAGNATYNAGTSSCTKAVLITKKPVQIKVGSFNIGYFECGSSSKTNCSTTWQKLGDYIRTFSLSIIGLQEIGSSSGSASSFLKRAGFSYKYSAFDHGGTMIGSKYAISSNSVTDLEKCDMTRGITKSIIKINGVNISYYNMHFGRDKDGCNTKHFKKLASLLKNDKNPVILTGDFNRTTTDQFNTYLKPLGAVIAAYDTSTNNMWGRKSYCDMVVVIPKDHIKVVSNKTINTYKKYSDHNFIYAVLNIY